MGDHYELGMSRPQFALANRGMGKQVEHSLQSTLKSNVRQHCKSCESRGLSDEDE